MPGSSGLGFAGGFIQGLAGSLHANREREQVQRDRQINNVWKGMQLLLDSGQVQDIADLQPQIDSLVSLGALPKESGGASKGPDVHAAIKNVLGQVLQKPLQPGPPAGAAGTAPDAPVGPQQAGEAPFGQAPLPSSPVSVPGASETPSRRTFMGAPVLSQDEAIQRKVHQQIAQEGAVTTAKIDLARSRILPALKAVDPSASLDDALAAVGVRVRSEGVPSFSVVPGEDAQGQPHDAILDHRTGTLVDAVTRQPIDGFRPRSTTGSTSLGADREAVARELFKKPASQLTGDEMAKVNTTLQDRAAGKAAAVTTARGDAEAKVPLGTKERFAAVMNLQDDWRKAEAPAKEMTRYVDIMDTALNRFEQDPAGASEAIRVAFEKILDPVSVVREGEYARQTQGLSMLDQFEGFKQRLLNGGGNIPKEVLAGMVQTAKEFQKGQATYNDLERDRITKTATEYGIDPDRVFGVAKAVGRKQEQEAAPQLAPYVLRNGKWVRPTGKP